MPTPTPKFRAADKTNPDYPNVTAWAVEVWDDGEWKLHLVDWMPVFRPTRERAQELADMLNRGESIDHLQKRGPGTASWKCPV